MVTKILHLETIGIDSVGTINAGLYADLVVMDTFHEDPYRNLIEAIDADVRLTVVNGQIVFGDIDLMSTLKGDDWEIIEGPGFDKAVDVTDRSEPEGHNHGHEFSLTWKWPWNSIQMMSPPLGHRVLTVIRRCKAMYSTSSRPMIHVTSISLRNPNTQTPISISSNWKITTTFQWRMAIESE